MQSAMRDVEHGMGVITNATIARLNVIRIAITLKHVLQTFLKKQGNVTTHICEILRKFFFFCFLFIFVHVNIARRLYFLRKLFSIIK